MQTRILIVDDERYMALSLASVLSKARYEVATANTYTEGLSYIQSQLFDFAILDVFIECKNGLDLIPEITHAHPETQIVILSADASETTISLALQKGVAAYLIKPIAPEKILGVFDHFLHSTPIPDSRNIRFLAN